MTRSGQALTLTLSQRGVSGKFPTLGGTKRHSEASKPITSSTMSHND